MYKIKIKGHRHHYQASYFLIYFWPIQYFYSKLFSSLFMISASKICSDFSDTLTAIKSHLRSDGIFRIKNLSNWFNFWFWFSKFRLIEWWKSSIHIKPQWSIISFHCSPCQKSLYSVKYKITQFNIS